MIEGHLDTIAENRAGGERGKDHILTGDADKQIQASLHG